jgi:hypothetical protein
MKNTLNAFTFLSTLFLLLSFGIARADDKVTTIKIFAEKGAEVRAQEFIDKLKETEPFKQLFEKNALNIVDAPIVVTTTKCKGGASGIDRLAQCDMKEVTDLCDKAYRCPLFTSVPFIGAGGAPSPIVSSSFPWTTMLHELIHTFGISSELNWGFTDEYAYTKSESKVYCETLTHFKNENQLKEAKIFKNKKSAEAACMDSIEWCEEALLSGSEVVTKVSDGWIIGSPIPVKCPDNTLGVYVGGGCEKTKPSSTYRPYYCPTVMGFPTLGQDYCEVQDRHAAIARMPNLIPPYYQLLIFRELARNRSDLKFKPYFEDFPASFSYGIPLVDNLPEGDRSQENFCHKKPEL